MFGFFGSLNPLSNFYDASFSLNGVKYSNSKQMIQHKKMEFFGDTDVALQILQCGKGHDCKRLSKEIHGFDRTEWENEAKILCSEGLCEKFKQNPRLKVYLLATGDKRIIESSYDPIWGTGIPLDDKAALHPRRWSNQGLLGEMLEEIRSILRIESVMNQMDCTDNEARVEDTTTSTQRTEESPYQLKH